MNEFNSDQYSLLNFFYQLTIQKRKDLGFARKMSIGAYGPSLYIYNTTIECRRDVHNNFKGTVREGTFNVIVVPF